MRDRSASSSLASDIEICPPGLTASFATAALKSLADFAHGAIRAIEAQSEATADASARVLLSRVRGTGPGVSFSLLVRAIETAFAAPLVAPFENSESVSGAPLKLASALGEEREDGLVRLRFAPGAIDLPLHAHDQSARCIFVVRGRGCFHAVRGGLIEPGATNVRHIPVRTRDVLVFRRGAIHTFSTSSRSLELFSFHAPFLELADPRQYRVIQPPMLPALRMQAAQSAIRVDTGWTEVA